MYENIEITARELTKAAYQSILADNISAAKKILKKIRRLKPITETNRSITFTEAAIFLQKKDKRQAKRRILNDNYGAWGSADLWYLLRLCNPLVDSNSKTYQMTLRGGRACFGFTCFSDQHECDLEVIANSQEEALQYARELCNFASPETVDLVSIVVSPPTEENYNRGIVMTSPFRVVSAEDVMQM
jgi:hypothetical protein